ncbi:hypothetical protein [Vitiosangium sp. GDMCC 1.1324]|uniref:hypothetical protein n=1 Tax=Vitiosangium sp. (strain GDMCC 1.1324) TaxID=2138576 RepID=UPI000D39F2C5|nr:hypothetical protein [Vitiosangium sp. GDMCC 1.1324]PTL79738.1 hypothetical protein DAT35_33610 [Vitiosangium sp. GDMCC 1.1324]
MTPSESGRLIDLQQERLRRGMPRYHREPIQTWRRKVKLTLAATALLGLLAGLLSIVMESTDESGAQGESLFDESPFRSSSGESQDLGDGPAWFTATQGSGRR